MSLRNRDPLLAATGLRLGIAAARFFRRRKNVLISNLGARNGSNSTSIGTIDHQHRG